MRLLDARTLELVDIIDNVVPPYAILSHTWGDEEITIQHLRRLGGSSQLTSSSPKRLDKKRRGIVSKKGYVKIAGAAQLALSRGLNYIWADTCCIDKTSSAELSEAINSMYLWYEQSAECYAFLSDVEPIVVTNPSAIHDCLCRSRWFTRGWTLQELVAPKLVLFYANDWSLLGQKHKPPEFTKVISEITGIDGEVLGGKIDPLQLSVSARMAWASHRNTTRLEDTAYCLMGLFQVNMPLLYGEGRRAFTRLQEEIIQRTDDQSIFAWNSFGDEDEDPDALFGLLAHSPAQFKDTGALQVLPPLPVYASAPSGMTNQGLRVQLYLLPRRFEDETVLEEDYFAILDCVKRDRDVYLCPALHLRRLSEDQYGRLRPKSQHFKAPISSYLWDAGYRSVYIRQQPVYYHLPQFRLSPLNVESGLGSSDGVQYRLLDKFPLQNWNSATMTLKVQYSRKLQAMGVFRFQNIEYPDEKLDVVVGLRRLKTMEWEGWCFQLSYRDMSLEHIFQEVNKKIEKITSISSSSEITSKTLRDSLGDDSTLTSSATVEGIQLQGRLYVSILVTLTAEILAHRELFQTPTSPIVLSRFSQMLSSTSANSGARAMTEMCCWSSGSPFVLDASSPLTWILQPVRATASSGGGTFMKPIYDFLASLKKKQSGKGSENALSVAEKLAEALFIGDVDQVQMLIAIKQPNIDSPTTDAYGLTPLHWAAVGGSAGCISLLRRNGASLKSLTKRGLSVAHIAALCNNKIWDALADSDDQVELTRLANERTKHFFETPMHLAAASGPDTEFAAASFKELIDWSWEQTGLAPRNAFDETPLHRAAAGNNGGAIRVLATRSHYCYIDNGDQYGRTPLWHAAAAGACNSILALIRLGASVDLTDDLGRSPLHAACRGGHHEAVNVLLENGARTDTETNFLSLLPMDLAAMVGSTKSLQFLLDPRWRVITQANLDRTLQIAASFGWHESVDFLCRHGANPYVASEYYLQARDGYAIVVEREADARTAALSELHMPIVSYFDTSESCRYLRERIYPPPEDNPPSMENPMPSFSAPISAPPPSAPPPAAESAPAYLPSHGQQYTPSYGNVPSYSSPAYGSTPSRDNAPPSSNMPHGSIPYGNTPSYSGHASQPGSLRYERYETLNRHQSANLPARASSNAYTPVPPTQSERLHELVNPYESSQGAPSQQRPITYAYSSAPAAETPSQDSSVSARNTSAPAPRPLSFRIVPAPMAPLDAALQNTRENMKSSGTVKSNKK